MIVVKLREAMQVYRARTGERMTYARLARVTGVARATLETIGSRPGYNTTLGTIEKICRALGCGLEDLLELREGGRPNRPST